VAKNRELHKAPTGSRNTLAAKSLGLALLLLIPINAGSIVVGVAAKIPPFTPPSFSTTKVARAATKPANSADATEVNIARSPNFEGGVIWFRVQEIPFI